MQELSDQLSKVKAEKEKAVKASKALKVSHDVSIRALAVIHTYIIIESGTYRFLFMSCKNLEIE